MNTEEREQIELLMLFLVDTLAVAIHKSDVALQVISQRMPDWKWHFQTEMQNDFLATHSAEAIAPVRALVEAVLQNPGTDEFDSLLAKARSAVERVVS